MIEKVTVENVLKLIPSGIGLDVSKNHTGVVIWDGIKTTEYGFELSEYNKEDPFAEYKMRREFKQKLKEIVEGKHFAHCVIEDVYGGENFDTVRKLLALNTVIDELIFDRSCFVDNFYRWKEPTWLSGLKLLYKQKGAFKSKIATQNILGYLEYDFYLKNKDLSNAKKKEIFFEDICDACGMLLAVVAKRELESNIAKSEKVGISQIKMAYIENSGDAYKQRDEFISSEVYTLVELDTRRLEAEVIKYATAFPNDVLCAYVPVDKLGNFGINHKFKFYESGGGYLIFYNKPAFKKFKK